MPFSSSSASVRMVLRVVAVKSAPELSDLIGSVKVSVTFPDASVTVSPAAGLNVTDGAVASTVNVASAAAPWLPSASYQASEIAT